MFLADGVVHFAGSRPYGGCLAAFGDLIDPRYIYALFVAMFGAGLVIIVNAHALWQVFVFAACIGSGFVGNCAESRSTAAVLFLMRRPGIANERG